MFIASIYLRMLLLGRKKANGTIMAISYQIYLSNSIIAPKKAKKLLVNYQNYGTETLQIRNYFGTLY